jgi:hypothetical protein
VIKSRRMRWARHGALMGRPVHRLENNIQMAFKKWGGEASTGLSWLRIGTGGELL